MPQELGGMACPSANALTVLASEPKALATFWGDLLGLGTLRARAAAGRGCATAPGFRALPSCRGSWRSTQIHFHLTSYTASQEANVARVSRGSVGSHLDVGQLPEEDHVVLADPQETSSP